MGRGTTYATVEEAVKALEKHDEEVECFYDDPITAECGCTDDFQEAFDRKERAILAAIAELAEKDSEPHRMACARMEKWMP